MLIVVGTHMCEHSFEMIEIAKKTVKLKLATSNLLQCRVPTQAANFQASLSPSEHWNNGAGKK